MSAAQAEQVFRVGDLTFKLSPLGVIGQLKALDLLAPILAGLRSGASLAGLARLPELYALFAPNTRVSGVPGQDPSVWLGLDAFGDIVFARRPSALIAFLGDAVRVELGDFLDESGRNVVREMAQRFGSLLKSTGVSGALPSTPA